MTLPFIEPALTSVVWGNDASGQSLVWGNSVVWGNSTTQGFSVVWGDNASALSVVWGVDAFSTAQSMSVLVNGDQQ